jgi:glycosyltransferase involved in cell wall biosynthesis
MPKGYPSASGGAERFQWLMSRALANSGWSVIVGVRGPISQGQEETIDGVRFVGMRPGNLLIAWSIFIREQKPDWWFWRAADPLWALLLIVARVNGVRGIFSAAFDTDVLPRVALFRRQRLWPLYALGLRMVDRIFVQHHGQFANLSPALRAKATVFPGIVAIPEKVIQRQDRGNYIVWVALLRPHKRPDLLIELAREAPDLQFVVCGGTTTFGTPREYSERIVKDLKSVPNIRYLGDVDHNKTLEIIAQATALLSTSDKEGFPNTFLEAWATGTPVVSLSIDPDSLIRNNRLGFVSGTVKKAAFRPSQSYEFT